MTWRAVFKKALPDGSWAPNMQTIKAGLAHFLFIFVYARAAMAVSLPSLWSLSSVCIAGGGGGGRRRACVYGARHPLARTIACLAPRRFKTQHDN
jgi:hypothetical protein